MDNIIEFPAKAVESAEVVSLAQIRAQKALDLLEAGFLDGYMDDTGELKFTVVHQEEII